MEAHFLKKKKLYDHGPFTIKYAWCSMLFNASSTLTPTCRVVHYLSPLYCRYMKQNRFGAHMTPSLFPKMRLSFLDKK